jgi:hypothetical protein
MSTKFIFNAHLPQSHRLLKCNGFRREAAFDPCGSQGNQSHSMPVGVIVHSTGMIASAG